MPKKLGQLFFQRGIMAQFYWLFRDNNTSGSAGGVKHF